MYTLVISSNPNTNSQVPQVKVRVLSFAQQEEKRRFGGAQFRTEGRKEKGRAYLVRRVLVAG
jgi:hypothetical protein